MSVGGLATSVASSPVTNPIRPPLATSQTVTPPQWRTLGVTGTAVLQSACTTRLATCALSRATNLLEKSLPMLTRVLTCTQKRLGGPCVTLVHSLPKTARHEPGSSGCRSRTVSAVHQDSPVCPRYEFACRRCARAPSERFRLVRSLWTESSSIARARWATHSEPVRAESSSRDGRVDIT